MKCASATIRRARSRAHKTTGVGEGGRTPGRLSLFVEHVARATEHHSEHQPNITEHHRTPASRQAAEKSAGAAEVQDRRR